MQVSILRIEAVCVGYLAMLQDLTLVVWVDSLI